MAEARRGMGRGLAAILAVSDEGAEERPELRELSVEHWLAPERRVLVYLGSSARVTTPPAELSMTLPHIAM